MQGTTNQASRQCVELRTTKCVFTCVRKRACIRKIRSEEATDQSCNQAKGIAAKMPIESSPPISTLSSVAFSSRWFYSILSLVLSHATGYNNV